MNTAKKGPQESLEEPLQPHICLGPRPKQPQLPESRTWYWKWSTKPPCLEWFNGPSWPTKPPRGGRPLHTSQIIIAFLSCESGWLLNVIANSPTNRRPFSGAVDLWSDPSWQSLNTLCKLTRQPRTSTLVSWARRLRCAWGPSGPGDYFHSLLPYRSWILKGLVFYNHNKINTYASLRIARWQKLSKQCL